MALSPGQQWRYNLALPDNGVPSFPSRGQAVVQATATAMATTDRITGRVYTD